MIVSDTDFLSSFAKIDELKLVFRVFKTKEIVITESVYNELKEAPVFDLLLTYFSAKENKIIIKKVSAKDVPENLGTGERESITLAKDKKAKLLMDDRDAGEYRTNSGKRRILYNEISSFEQFLGAIRILWDNKHDVQKPRGESGFRGGIVEIINLYNDRSYT